MRYKFPSLKLVLLAFLIIGPFLAPTVFGILLMFRDGISSMPNPIGTAITMIFVNFLGTLFWWWAAFFYGHNGWKITIFPTIVAALLYYAAMGTITPRVLFKSKLTWLVSNTIICACVSGLVFYFVTITFNFGFNNMSVTPALQKYGSTTSVFFTAVVFTLGAILGLILALFSKQHPAH